MMGVEVEVEMVGGWGSMVEARCGKSEGWVTGSDYRIRTRWETPVTSVSREVTAWR